MTETTIGVDISKDHLDAHRLPDTAARRFANTAAGHRAFRKWAGHEIARIVYEPTGPYHRAFEGACAKAGLPLCKVNPRQARRFAQAIGVQAKTDIVDARMLARMGVALTLQSRPVADENILQLRQLRVAHQALVKERTRLKNRRQTLTLPLLKRQHDKRLRQIECDIADVIAAIAAAIADDKALARRYDILVSIPGLGQIAAIALIADMPELGTVDARQIASLAGLAPFARSSGNWRGKARIGGGRKTLRDAIYMPALVAARFNNDLRDFYQRLIAAGKPPKPPSPPSCASLSSSQTLSSEMIDPGPQILLDQNGYFGCVSA